MATFLLIVKSPVKDKNEKNDKDVPKTDPSAIVMDFNDSDPAPEVHDSYLWPDKDAHRPSPFTTNLDASVDILVPPNDELHLCSSDSQSPIPDLGSSALGEENAEGKEELETVQELQVEVLEEDSVSNVHQVLDGSEIMEEEGEEQTPTPEHFVWLLFKAFVGVTFHMHKANAIHLDLHLGNILLGKDTDERMGGYGIKPLVADFGYALPVGPERFNNTEDFKGLGKEQTWAPEQIITHPRLVQPPKDGPAIGEHTSVFQLGVLVHSILNGGVLPDFTQLDLVFKYRAGEHPAINPVSVWKYRDLFWTGNGASHILSEDRYLDKILLDCHNDDNGTGTFYRGQLVPFMPLIKRCLAFQPVDRIALDDLRAETGRELGRFEAVEVDAEIMQDRVQKRKLGEIFGEYEDEVDAERAARPPPTRRRR